MSWPSNSKLPLLSRLTADVMLALENDFRGSGADAIARLRRNRPWNYLQLIRSVVDLKAAADLKPNEVSDDELSALIEGARDALAKIKAWEEEAAAEEAAAASAQRASPP